ITSMQATYDNGNLVATAASGVAANLIGGGGPQCAAYYSNNGFDIVTGGGKIKMAPNDVFNTTDTTGTRPEVGACAQAIQDVVAGSAQLAAMPPVKTLGNVVVHLNEEATIDATGGGVIQVDSITMQASPKANFGEGPLLQSCVASATL